MSRFARIALCTAALTFWMMALPLISAGQHVTIDSQGRALVTVAPSSNTPSTQVAKPDAAIPEGTAVIYSDLGSGDSFNCCSFWGEFGADNGYFSPQIAAMAFMPTKSVYQLSQIDIAMSYFIGANGYTLELCQDDDGQPGRMISSWEVTGLPTAGSTSSQVQTIKASQVILLAPYHQYWLVPVVNSNELAGWSVNTVGAYGTVAWSTNGGETWTVKSDQLCAFDVLGVPLSLPLDQ